MIFHSYVMLVCQRVSPTNHHISRIFPINHHIFHMFTRGYVSYGYWCISKMPESNVAQAGGPGYPEWLVDDLLRHMPRSGKAAWHKGQAASHSHQSDNCKAASHYKGKSEFWCGCRAGAKCGRFQKSFGEVWLGDMGSPKRF